MQVPPWMDLNAKVTQATFVFDVDKTLTTGGNGTISGLNLDQLVRAVRLRKVRPDLKIKVILISGSAYKRFVVSRFGRKVSQLDWQEIKSQQMALGIRSEVVDQVKGEI